MSSDSLLKCLPWIIRAIQSNLGLALACRGLRFHIFLVLVGAPGGHFHKTNADEQPQNTNDGEEQVALTHINSAML